MNKWTFAIFAGALLVVGAGFWALNQDQTRLSLPFVGKPSLPAEATQLGSKDAKVSVIEYWSPLCDHCARYHASVFPAFKSRYVDTGMVRYERRETTALSDEWAKSDNAYGAAIATMALIWCKRPDAYQFEQRLRITLERAQGLRTPVDAGNGEAALLELAKEMALTEETARTCLNDREHLALIRRRVERHNDESAGSGIKVPGFVVDSAPVEGGPDAVEDAVRVALGGVSVLLPKAPASSTGGAPTVAQPFPALPVPKTTTNPAPSAPSSAISTRPVEPPPARAGPSQSSSAAAKVAPRDRQSFARRLQSFFPERALARNRSGQVVLDLAMDASGRVTSATVISEDPTGWGFGDAAIAGVAGQIMVEPTSGQPVERGVFRVSFALAN